MVDRQYRESIAEVEVSQRDLELHIDIVALGCLLFFLLETSTPKAPKASKRTTTTTKKSAGDMSLEQHTSDARKDTK